MATQTQTQTAIENSFKIKAKHDFNTLIGYTKRPLYGGEPPMDDLASENPIFRDVRKAKVVDLRGAEDKFTLEKHGFQYYKLPEIPGNGIVDFTDENDPRILQLYYPGMSEWFAKVFVNAPHICTMKLKNSPD